MYIINVFSHCAGGEGVPSGQSSPLFGVGVSSGRSSPLFDEFSDGEEFEFPGRKRRTSENRSKGKGQFLI